MSGLFVPGWGATPGLYRAGLPESCGRDGHTWPITEPKRLAEEPSR